MCTTPCWVTTVGDPPRCLHTLISSLCVGVSVTHPERRRKDTHIILIASMNLVLQEG